MTHFKRQLETSRRHLGTLDYHLFLIVPWVCIVIKCWFCSWSLVVNVLSLNGCLDPSLVQFMCSIFVALWRGSVKYHGPSRCPPDSSEFCHGLCLQFSNMWSVPKQQGTGNGPLLAIPRSNRVPYQLWTEFCAGFHCKCTDTRENDCFCSDNMHKHPFLHFPSQNCFLENLLFQNFNQF
jgi:hypothetical protein